MTGAVRLALVALTIWSAACGAKTGLYADDGGAPNQLDAPMDTGPMPPCIEVPFEGESVELDLEISAIVGRADITFLIDQTASMGDEIDRIRSRLRDQIAPAIQEAIPDSQLAVATFADFPVEPYGARSDTPFELRLPMSDELAAVQAAVNSIELSDGRDVPESLIEGLYQLATGEGIRPYVDPSAGCSRGGEGYACTRPDSLPVILAFTDNASHNGPRGANPYLNFPPGPAPHTYNQAIEELARNGTVVIGFDSGGGSGGAHLRAIARDTGAVADGQPLVYDIGSRGERLGTSVVDAIQTLASTVIQDVDAQFFDPAPGDGVPILEIVEGIVPLSASPMSGIDRIDLERGAFIGARAGTVLRWRVELRNDAVMPGPTPQRFTVEVRFRGDARRFIERVLVDIVIPSVDGLGCEAL
ncbi:MAG: vWA domain-containing protein [Polyangiales bacterium]